MKESVAVLDFGSQYAQLIARRIRELGVYCEILRHDITRDELVSKSPKALVFSGGPASVLNKDHPEVDPGVFDMGIPILGICYGMQLTALMLKGKVAGGKSGEYGHAVMEIVKPSILFSGMGKHLDVWMSHGDRVQELPPGFEIIASSPGCEIAAMADPSRNIYGVQFHPEVVHTPKGSHIIKNFLYKVAGCSGSWTMAGFIEESVERIRDTVRDERVICALSGGVDSAVTAALVGRAIGDNMIAIFVDNGLMRSGEADEIRYIFTKEYPLNIHMVDASKEFLNALRGVIDPEKKRKIIGKTFIDIFSREAEKVGGANFLAQGTLYPDVIESRSPRGGPSATIKSHHNVGGLPKHMKFKLLEPLKELFKDEVRQLGKELGLPERLLKRQPFPGPGLAVRILGEVTEEGLSILREADLKVQEEMQGYDNIDDVWQSFAVLLPVKSVGVMGDERTYSNVVAIRVVTSLDGMTADWVRLPYDILEVISSRIINEVRGVNRVVYDISTKPPSTIEWE